MNAKRKRDNDKKKGRGREIEGARTKLRDQSHVLNIPTQRAAASRRPALLRRRRVPESPFGGCCRCCEVGGERGRMGGVVERGWRDDGATRRGAARRVSVGCSRLSPASLLSLSRAPSPPSVFHLPRSGSFLFYMYIYRILFRA